GPAAEPTVQASNVTFSSVGATSMTVSWTNGNGASRIVLAKQGAPVDAAPSDGTAYTASAAFGSGSELSPMTVTTSSALAVRSSRTSVVALPPTGRAMLLAGSRAAFAAPQPTRAATTTVTMSPTSMTTTVAAQPTNNTASGATQPTNGTM